MKKFKILSVLLMLCLLASAQTINVENVTLNVNGSANVSIKLTGGSAFIATGFSIVLPEGFSFTGDVTNGTDSHVIKSYLNSDNVMKVAIFSGTNTSFGTNETILLNLGIKAGSKTGTYQGKIKGIEFSNSSKELVTKIDVTFTITVKGMVGDVNMDGTVNITDVSQIVEFIVGRNPSNFNTANADLNGDGTINITDVIMVVKIILGEGDNEDNTAYLTCPDENHPHLIDLGLPSGTKWACCNVGAEAPENYGGYYAWGETEEKDVYDWSTYIHCNKSSSTCHDLGSDISGTQYDVAQVKWSDFWVMPFNEQIDELVGNCSRTWISLNGIEGCLFTGPNGGTVFFPAGGNRWSGNIRDSGSGGYYWSSIPYASYRANLLNFGSAFASRSDYANRSNGYMVRPVSSKTSLLLAESNVEMVCGEKINVRITFGNGNYTVVSRDDNVATASIEGSFVKVTAIGAGTTSIVVTDEQRETATIEITNSLSLCADEHHPHMIDLGLPSGTKWSCCNVGANTPENKGGYYAWGETETKGSYNWSSYIHSDGSLETCHDIGENISGTEYDVAHVKWGGNWRMPTFDQNEELLNNTTSRWTTINGVNGWKFTGNNGGTIFLPAVGHKLNSYDLYNGNRGYYWSSSGNTGGSYDLFFDSDGAFSYSEYSYYGQSVRPIVRN